MCLFISLVLFFFCVRLLAADDEEALNSIMQDLAALGRYSSHKHKNRTLLYKQVHITSECIHISSATAAIIFISSRMSDWLKYNYVQMHHLSLQN